MNSSLKKTYSTIPCSRIGNECRIPVDVLRNVVVGDYAAVDIGVGEGATTGLGGIWLLLSLQ